MGKFLAKWLLDGIVVAPLLLWFAGVSFISSVIAATVLTIIAWFVGDKLILPATNNIIAVLSDALLAFVYLGLLAYMLRWDLGLGELFVVAVVVGAAEWVFHRYFLRDEVLSTV